MKGVELYGRVRHAVRIEGLSDREAARRFGIDPRTVAKMMVFSVPPGYRRKKPKLDPFIGIIERIVEEDKRRPAKQQRQGQGRGTGRLDPAEPPGADAPGGEPRRAEREADRWLPKAVPAGSARRGSRAGGPLATEEY
jgi:hypothetical protein